MRAYVCVYITQTQIVVTDQRCARHAKIQRYDEQGTVWMCVSIRLHVYVCSCVVYIYMLCVCMYWCVCVSVFVYACMYINLCMCVDIR